MDERLIDFHTFTRNASLFNNDVVKKVNQISSSSIFKWGKIKNEFFFY